MNFPSAPSVGQVYTFNGRSWIYTSSGTWDAYSAPASLTKADVGLDQVDNTSDANKPVSTAQQTALDAKANLAGATFTGAISATNLSGTNTGDQDLSGLQPKDATLTSLAGLSWSAGTQVLTLTAADTFTLKTVGNASGNILDKTAGDSLYLGISATAADSSKLGGVVAANYVRGDTTYLGATGSVSFDSATNTAAAWANLPVGYSRMMANSIGTAGGAPVANYGYFTKVANRDTGGGWGGLWIGYANGQSYVGHAPDNATLASWEQIYTTSFKPTATDVGLGNVNNTSDANKPVSTAQQTALDAKANLSGGNTFTGNQTITGNTTVSGSFTASGSNSTFGTNNANATNILQIANPGVGYGSGFNFVKSSDGAGITVTEYASDQTLYEFWMSDNPDTTQDIFQWRWTDWEGKNGLYVPLKFNGLTANYTATTHNVWGQLNQSATAFYTTGDPNNANTSLQNIQAYNTVANTAVTVAGTVTLTALDVSGYTGTTGVAMWLKASSTTAFDWGYGSFASGTAQVTGVAFDTNPITLSNGVKVTFSATTGATVGDAWQWRTYRAPANALGATTYSGQLISTLANNTATGGGQVYLNGATGNRIDFNTAGTAAPAFTTRSVGTKIVLYPNIGASTADYALGMEANTMWSSVPGTNSQFKWYGGTTQAALLTGAGALTLTSTLQASNFSAGASVSGTNTGDQTISLTGDVTASGGTGALTTSIGANKVTRSMLVATAGAALLGATAAGNVGDLTGTQATALLDTFTLTAKGLVPAPTTSTGKFLKDDGTWAAPADVAATWGSITGTLSSQSDLNTALGGKQPLSTQLTNFAGTAWVAGTQVPTLTAANTFTLKTVGSATGNILDKAAGDSLYQPIGTYATGGGTATGTNTGDQTITLTGDVTGSGTGSFAATIASGAVTLAKMANMATGSLIYRKTAGTGAPEVQTLATLKTDLGLTGTNSGDQTITLTGDVTGSGTGSFATAIGANKVTRGMLAATAGATILGATAAGNVSDLTAAQAKTFLAIASTDVSGLATVATSGSAADLSAGTLAAARMPALTGDVTTSVGTVATTIAAGAVTLAKMANMATGSLIYRKTAGTGAPEVNTLATLKTDLGLTGTNSGDQTITLTGDVTGSGTGSFAATIAAGSVTLAKQANLAANSIIGNNTGVAATPIAMTAAQTKTLLAIAASDVSGLAATATSTNAANLTGTLAAAQLPALSGDVSTSAGSATTSIGANKVTRGMLAATASAALLGATGAGNVSDLTGTQVTTLLDTFTTSLKGLAPASGGGTTNFLRADGTWAAPPGGGGTTTNALTLNNSGSGAASGSTFNGSAPITLSYNTIGAAPTASPTFTGTVSASTLSVSGSINSSPLYTAKLASTANFANTTPTSTVLTASATGATTIDGTTLALNDIVLLKDQSNGQENGVYTVTTAGTTGVATVLTRVAELNTWLNIALGTKVTVTNGTLNADSVWLCTANSGGTLGTTAIGFKCIAHTAAQITPTGYFGIVGSSTFAELDFSFPSNNGAIWLDSTGLNYQASTANAHNFSGTLNTAASSTTRSGFNLPHGSAPTTPNNGDTWTTTGGLFARINGSTVQFATGTGTATGTNTGDQTITLTGAVTGSGTGSFATTLANSIVGLANMANVATGTVFYRKTAGTGAPEVNTLATLKTDLGLTGTNSGDQTITLTGDVTGSGTGSFATAIGANKVTRSMLAATAGAAFLGATAAGNVSDLTATQATALLNTFTSTLQGVVPSSGGGTTNFLRADGTWTVPVGPTANALTINNSGAGAGSGSTFTGSSAVTISYNSIGAAPTANPTFTGTVTIPTPAQTSNTTDAASTAWVVTTMSRTILGVSGGTTTLTQTQAATGIFELAGTLTSNLTINFGSGSAAFYNRTYTILNTTSGAFTVTLQACATSPSGSVTVAQGTAVTVYTDGAVMGLALDSANQAVFSSTLKGVVPSSGGGTTNFLRADGTWVVPVGPTTNSLTFNNAGSGAASGTTFNGSAAQTISYNTIGAAPTASPTFTGTVTASTINGSGSVALQYSGSTKLQTATDGISVTGAVMASTVLVPGNLTAASAPSASTYRGGIYYQTDGTTGLYYSNGTSWALIGGGGGTTTNSLTFNNAGSGAASGSTFNGSAAQTISYNSIGAVSTATPVITGTLVDIQGNPTSTATIRHSGSTGGYFAIENTGGTYGTSRLTLGNESGMNGATFETTDATITLVDFLFKTGAASQNIGGLRFEKRSGSLQYSTNTSWEMQLYNSAALASAPLVVGDGGVNYRGILSGSGAVTSLNTTADAAGKYYGFSHNRGGVGGGEVGYHMYNGGAVQEWFIYQPAGATGSELRFATVNGATRVDRLVIDPSTGKATFSAPTTSGASINLGHGTAPTSPVNGDVWTTTAGMYVRINGATVGPLGSGGGGGTTTNALTLATSGGAAPGTTFNGSAAVTMDYSTIGAAPLASPTFTGVPAGPTATADTNTTQFATTAFVQASEAAIAVAVTGGTVNLTAAQCGVSIIVLTGTLTSNLTVNFGSGTAANFNRLYTVYNTTSGAFTCTLRACATSPSGSLTVAQGTTVGLVVYNNFIDQLNDVANSDVFTSTAKGVTPASGGGTTNFLRADGTWAAPPAGGGTTTNAVTFNNGGAGAASGTTFDGSIARTISYNTLGAAPLASPTFTGTPAAPTPSFGTATTQLATTAYVDGFRDIPQVSKTAAYTLALTDRGQHISITTGGITVPANSSVAFPVGSTVTIYNNSASSQTIAITTDTMYLAGTATTGSRTLAQRGLATLLKVASTTWVISGAGVT